MKIGITQLSAVIATLEVIEVKGVNDDTQSMKIRNDGSPLFAVLRKGTFFGRSRQRNIQLSCFIARYPQGGGSAMRGVSMEDGRWKMEDG